LVSCGLILGYQPIVLLLAMVPNAIAEQPPSF